MHGATHIKTLCSFFSSGSFRVVFVFLEEEVDFLADSYSIHVLKDTVFNFQLISIVLFPTS
jgi:hypothetical protein